MGDYIYSTQEKKIEYQQFTYRIEEELMTKLRKLSIQTNKNEFINESIKFTLDNLKIE